MRLHPRRSALAALGGTLVGSLAGCVGRPLSDLADGKSPTQDEDTTDADGSEPERVTAEPVDLSAVPDGAAVAVFHEGLREWIREATSGKEVRVQGRPTRYEVRAFEEYAVDFFPLDEVETATVSATAYDLDGTFTVEARMGTGDPSLYVAREVDSPPDNATVTSVAELADEQQDFALDVLDANPYGDDATVMTYDSEIFEWADDDLVGEYIEYRDRYYEVTETHVETQEWPPTHYALRLRMDRLDEPGAELTFELPEVDETTRTSIEATLREGVVEVPSEASFGRSYDYLLTPVAVWRLSVEEETLG